MDKITVNVTPKEIDYTYLNALAVVPFNIRVWAPFLISGPIAGITSTVIVEYLNTLPFYKDLPEIVLSLDDIFFIFSIFFLTYSFLRRYYPIKYTHPQGDFLRPKEYSIDENGIQATNAFYTGFTSWEGILKIEENKNIILFYVDLISAYPIPKDAFATTIEADAFVRKAKDFHQAALRNGDKNPSALPRTPSNTRWDE